MSPLYPEHRFPARAPERAMASRATGVGVRDREAETRRQCEPGLSAFEIGPSVLTIGVRDSAGRFAPCSCVRIPESEMSLHVIRINDLLDIGELGAYAKGYRYPG